MTNQQITGRATGTALVMRRVGGTLVPEHTDPRCRVCNSPLRYEAEEHIVAGVSFKRINDRMPEGTPPFSDRSLRRHHKLHMSLEQSEMRGIVERRSERIGRRIEDAEEALVDGITLLEVAVQKGFEAIATGEAKVTIREAISAVKILADLGEYDQAEMDQQAYVEAFTIYQEEALKRLGPEEFQAFGESLERHPVLRALVSRYGRRTAESDEDEDVPEVEDSSEDS